MASLKGNSLIKSTKCMQSVLNVCNIIQSVSFVAGLLTVERDITTA
jgi:hypothetical protein